MRTVRQSDTYWGFIFGCNLRGRATPSHVTTPGRSKYHVTFITYVSGLSQTPLSVAGRCKSSVHYISFIQLLFIKFLSFTVMTIPYKVQLFSYKDFARTFAMF